MATNPTQKAVFHNPVIQCVTLPTQSNPFRLTLALVSQGNKCEFTLVRPFTNIPKGTSLEVARQCLLKQKWTTITVLEYKNHTTTSFAINCEDSANGGLILSIHAIGYEEAVST